MKLNLDVTALVSEEATVVEVQGDQHYLKNRPDFVGQGWSKVHPNDDPNPTVGFSIAMARALRDLADRYEAHAALQAEMMTWHPGGLVVAEQWAPSSFSDRIYAAPGISINR